MHYTTKRFWKCYDASCSDEWRQLRLDHWYKLFFRRIVNTCLDITMVRQRMYVRGEIL